MPDISMCLNSKCPSCVICYRYTAEPNQWRQNYIDFKPNESGKCEDYIEARSKSQVFRLKDQVK